MKVLSYSDTGTRLNNEDWISLTDYAFVLCDGVGGIDKGEVASRFVGESFISKIRTVKTSGINIELIQKLIVEIQTELNHKVINQPDLLGMGTTFCAVVFSDKDLICAHIGDSRIYIIDIVEEKYWKTTDHSLSGELVKSGIIKESKRQNHPFANQLTRAIQAVPDMGLAVADIHRFYNINSKHLIFICSDGVNEAVNDFDLVNLLCNKDLTIDEKFAGIKESCIQNSKDNNSAILVQPDDDCMQPGFSPEKTSWIYLRNKENPGSGINKEEPVNKSVYKTFLYRKRGGILFISIVLTIILLVILLILN